MVKKLKRKPRQKKYKNTTFDIAKIKKIIDNDLYSNYNTIEKENIVKNNDVLQILSKEQEDKIYYNKYTKYITEEFNSSIVNMLVVFINRSKTFPLKYQKEPFFIIKLVNLLKHLLMNEFEISYFTIFVDRIGWSYKYIDHWTYFCILGIYTIKLCGKEEDSSLLINIISRNTPEFMDYYTNLTSDEDVACKINEGRIDVKAINERFRKLTKPINSFCRKNFINYHGIVDNIIKLSQPYGDESNGKQLRCNEKINNNNGIIDNEIRLNSSISDSIKQNNYIDINYLKINLCIEHSASNNNNNQKNNNIYKNRTNYGESIHNYILPSLNLSLYNNSQFSFNFSNI